MKQRFESVPIKKRLEAALAEIGGEPLVGSGFETESPEPEFSGGEPDAALPPQ